jgi:hypothetical protein
MYYATNGVPFYVNTILREATTIAAKIGHDSIDENHLYEAFNMVKITNWPLFRNSYGYEKFNILDAFELEDRINSSTKVN